MSETETRIPISTHDMWVIACQDLESEQARTTAIKSMPGVTPATLAECERRIRLRHTICNAIDFLITNKDDIKAVIAAKGGKRK